VKEANGFCSKKYDVPWKEMEKQDWMATAICTEIRLPLDEERRMDYAVAEARHKFRMARRTQANCA